MTNELKAIAEYNDRQRRRFAHYLGALTLAGSALIYWCYYG